MRGGLGQTGQDAADKLESREKTAQALYCPVAQDKMRVDLLPSRGRKNTLRQGAGWEDESFNGQVFQSDL